MYSSIVTETSPCQTEAYTGLAKRPFKVRWKEHLRDFEKPECRIKSTLTGHIWNIKDNELGYTVD